jgi:amidohydrolase
MIANTEILAIVDRITPQLVEFRRKLHRRPELAFEEHETARAIAAALRAAGIEPRTGIGRTGVVSVVDGGGGGRCIGVRADTDALPVTERTGLEFASETAGRMHACGHDVHTAIAVGVARVLAELRGKLKGSVKLIFQPAEETLAGALAMIADGVLENPAMDAILGCHNWPSLMAGRVGFYTGAVMASSDAFDIVLTGKSAHAAHPHAGIDALTGSAQLITALQTVVSREISPTVPAVVTVGQIEGGTARNIIAERVTVRGTARTLDANASKQVEAAVRRIVANVAAAFRLEHDITWQRQSPVLNNDPRLLSRVLTSARDILGPQNVVDLGHASMGAEDFAWFAERIPAAHLRIGSRIDGLETSLHRSNYDCSEKAIPVGVQVLTRAVIDLLDDEA